MEHTSLLVLAILGFGLMVLAFVFGDDDEL